MTYSESLLVWGVARPHKGKTEIIGKYKSRSDAEGHVQTLTRLTRLSYEIVFLGGDQHG